MNKFNAIQYLISHNVYNDEWSGSGMYVAIEKVVKYPDDLWRKIDNKKKFLDGLLKEADNF